MYRSKMINTEDKERPRYTGIVSIENKSYCKRKEYDGMKPISHLRQQRANILWNISAGITWKRTT